MKFLYVFNDYELYFSLYVVGINIITFIVYGIDKTRAKNKSYRIPEVNLILLSLIGGGVGALMAMVIYKHKLSKKLFYIGIPLIIILNKFLELVILSYIR